MTNRIIYICSLMSVMLLLGSCSADDVLSDATTEGIDESVTPRIELSIGAPSSVSADATSRGQGIVGTMDTDTAATENCWRGEKLYILMTDPNSSTLDFAYFSQTNRNNGIPVYGIAKSYTGTQITAPKDSPKSLVSDCSGQLVKYYPVSGQYDFFGYYIDDCKTSSVDTSDPTRWVLPIKVNGSQDVLMAKAEPYLLPINDIDAQAKAMAFSAYSGRKGLQPHLNFKHVMTHLRLYVKPGNSRICGLENDSSTTAIDALGIFVDSVRIQAPEDAYLTIAYNKNAKGIGSVYDQITSGPAETMMPFYELEKNGKRFDEKTFRLEWNNGAVEKKYLGDIIVPSQSSYVLRFYVHEVNPETGKKEPYIIALQVRNSATGFEKGKSYNVNITLNGLVDAETNTTLTNWNYNRDTQISITPEDNYVK